MKCEWKECVLSDVADIVDSLHKTPKYTEHGIPMLRVTDIKEGYLSLRSSVKVSLDIYDEFTKKHKPEIGDIVISRVGTYGVFSYVNTDERFCLGQNTAIIIPHINTKYLYYFLMSPMVKKYLSSVVTGSTQKTISLKNIKTIPLHIPSDVIQKRIANILSALDDKIECNNKINENLQQQAQAIYENMFTGFRTSQVELSNIIDVRDGTHNSPKAENEGYPLITSKHLLPFSVDRASANRISKDDFEKINERSLVETQDILMSMIGTIGLISYVSYPVVDFAIKNVALFKTSHSPEFAYYILCYLKSNATKQYIEKHLAGSTQKYISLRELRKMPVYQPSNTELEKFNFLVKPMFEDIVLRVNENIYLSEIRNTLLPKLMNGEIDIDGI